MIFGSCKAIQSPVYPLNASSRTGLVSTKTPRIRLVVDLGRGSSPTAQNAVTDSVEICLLQGLRDYEIRRAVIIRSIGRPKFVCVPTAPAQLRGVRFS